MAFHRGEWKITTKWKTVLFEHTGFKNDLTKGHYNEVSSGLMESELKVIYKDLI